MIVYKKLTEAELDTFIGMRITQLTEEYTAFGFKHNGNFMAYNL